MRTLAIALAISVAAIGNAAAQADIGTGARGGVCFGVNCGPGTPEGVGVGATSGPCFGPRCGDPAPPSIYEPPQPGSNLDPYAVERNRSDPYGSVLDPPDNR